MVSSAHLLAFDYAPKSIDEYKDAFLKNSKEIKKNYIDGIRYQIKEKSNQELFDICFNVNFFDKKHFVYNKVDIFKFLHLLYKKDWKKGCKIIKLKENDYKKFVCNKNTNGTWIKINECLMLAFISIIMIIFMFMMVIMFS